MRQTNNRSKKEVLIVDDEPLIRELLRERFIDCNTQPECVYEFEVEAVLSAAECIKRVRAKRFDVIVLDVIMEGGSGLDASFELFQQLGWETPIRIIVTGYPNYRHCVEAMRYGAWDYIPKEDVGETHMGQIVVDSALARLNQLALRSEQEQQIASEWLPKNLWTVQEKYGGRLVAIVHQPAIDIIASGADAFELEDNLGSWRQQHKFWEQPFIVKIPERLTLTNDED